MADTWDNKIYLADPADLAARLGAPTDDAKLLASLKRASDRFIGQIGYPLHKVTDDEYWATGDGGPTIALPAAPIVGDPTVEINGTPATGYQVGRRSGLLWRPGGWPCGLENVCVVYTHGYDQIPGDVQDAVLDAAEADHSIRAGIESVTTGNESVKFASNRVAGGTTPAWAAAVDKYTLHWAGDGE